MDVSFQNKSGMNTSDEKAAGSQGSKKAAVPKADATSAAAAPTPAALATAETLDSFDLSAYDPLQAHVLQLAASAGYPMGAQLQQQQQQIGQSSNVAQAAAATQPQQFSAAGALTTAALLAPAPDLTLSAATSSAPVIGAGVQPSVVSMSSGSATAANNQDFFKDKTLPDSWNTMTAEEKRRYERNVREQQRSYQISQQIKELRGLLAESNIPFKPNKYSILVSVAQYIQQLQARAIMLDAEHRKLIHTIRQTGEMVNSGQAPPADEVESSAGGVVGNDSEMLLVQGLDYRLVFDQCSAALGVTSLDGRIIDCNTELLNMFGCTKEHVLTKTVFDLVDKHEEVYQAMGQMLKREAAAATSSAGRKRKAQQDSVEDEEFPSTPLYWSGLVSKKGSTGIILNVSLSRNQEGAPRFFNFTLTTE